MVMRGLVSASKDRQRAGGDLTDAAVKASSAAVEFIRNACKKINVKMTCLSKTEDSKGSDDFQTYKNIVALPKAGDAPLQCVADAG